MKIVFCNLGSIPPYSNSGAVETIEELLTALTSQGHEVISINCNENYLLKHQRIEKYLKNHVEVINYPFKKIIFSNTFYFKQKIPELMGSIKPDVVLSQLNYEEELIALKKSLNYKLIQIIHSKKNYSRYFTASSDYDHNCFDLTVYVSNFLKQDCPLEHRRKSICLYPIIPKEKYFCPNEEPRNKIIFFNPIPEKGWNIVKKLAILNPHEHFLVYYTWMHN